MFAPLYWKDRIWKVDVTERDQAYVITRTYGKMDGKQTTSEKIVTAGKNVGKANETTAQEQAMSEAKSLWIKQQTRSQYSPTPLQVSTKPSPMLAHKLDVNKPPSFPWLLQPKLDGVRLLVYKTDGVIHMDSRTGKAMEDNELLFDIRKECEAVLLNDTIFDGELYLHGQSFENIVSICKTEKKKGVDERKLEYHVYDLISNEPFSKRYAQLCDIIHHTSHIKRVSCVQVDTMESFYDMHSEYVQQGYEGTMVRKPNSPYEMKRSKGLQKHKDFEEDEFVIVDAKEGQGNDTGTIICECKTSDKTFWVRPRGDRSFRTHLFENRTSLIGKKMTVIYQNMTTTGVPRFPVGKCIRDYE